MELDIIGLVSACSYALDCIEAELVHVTNRHGKELHTSVYMAWQKFGIIGGAAGFSNVCAATRQCIDAVHIGRGTA